MSLRVVCVTGLPAAILFPGESAGIAPPRDGVPVPAAYHERKALDREAFTFRRAWHTQTVRARERREALRREGLLDAAGLWPGARVEGVRRIPVLAGAFADSGPDPFPPAALEAHLFTGPNPTGTVTDYYREVSYGALTLTGTVVGDEAGNLLRAPESAASVEAGCNGLCAGSGTGRFLRDLLDAADGRVDFAAYDNDGPDGIPNSGDDDGYADVVAFVHASVGGECGGSGLWSHRWVYEGWWGEPYTTGDPAAGGGFIRVSDYTLLPLLACDGGRIADIGVFAHEFGHAFGLPDLYDTDPSDGASAGVGNWCLMGSGSWGGDGLHPESPAHLSAWAKAFLGWVTPRELCGDEGSVAFPGAARQADALRVYPHGLAGSEYFLVENRVQEGFDRWLPASGLAVWHVHEDEDGNGDETRKLLALEEADGLGDLDAARNRGDAGDLYTAASGRFVFSDDTIPDARDRAGQPTGFSLVGTGTAVDPLLADVTVTPCRLAAAGVMLRESGDGNGNRALEEGERATLEITLRNDFDRVWSGVRGTLISTHPGVLVHAATSDFGTLARGAEVQGTSAFEIEAVRALAPGDRVEFRLELLSEGGATDTVTFPIYAGKYVLVVEDDGGGRHASYYLDAVEAAGYPAVHHDTARDGLPALAQLKGAQTVVWYTGILGYHTLSADEQDLIRKLLDRGGSLFLSGQDLGWGLVEKGGRSDRIFYEEVLRARYVLDTSHENTLTGLAGDPVGDGLNLRLGGGDGAGNSTWPSEIAPGTGAAAVLEYAPGRTGAIRYEGEYRLVYLAFNFEAVGDAASRRDLMTRAVSWLAPPPAGAAGIRLLEPAPGTRIGTGNPLHVRWDVAPWAAADGVSMSVSWDGGGSWQPLRTGLPSRYGWVWTVPDSVSTRVRLRATARDAEGRETVDVSGMLSVVDDDRPQLVVLRPAPGEILATGSVIEIEGLLRDNVGVDSAWVEASLDGGRTWFEAVRGRGGLPLAWQTPATPSDSCRVRVRARDAAGNGTETVVPGLLRLVAPGGITGAFRNPVLLQNAPNPMVGRSTIVGFYLPAAAEVSLRIHDLSGALVRSLAGGMVDAGYHERSWDGRDDRGAPAGAGIYFTVLRTGGRTEVRKLVKTR